MHLVTSRTPLDTVWQNDNMAIWQYCICSYMVCGSPIVLLLDNCCGRIMNVHGERVCVWTPRFATVSTSNSPQQLVILPLVNKQ